MRYRSVFDIIGPAMVGPSSSHTAGANRIGQLARKLAGAMPTVARITFYGSFAETYQGHGTDRAIVAGLLGLRADDLRIRDALTLAREAGMDFSLDRGSLEGIHPNSVRVELPGSEDAAVNLVGISLGGGRVEVIELDGYNVRFSGDYPTLILRHTDRIGVVQSVGAALATHCINVSHMEIDRKFRGGEAIAVIEMDQAVGDETLSELRSLAAIRMVKQLEAV